MMGSFYTTIVVGVLLSIFVSVIIAETPLDEVGNINTYYKDGGKSKYCKKICHNTHICCISERPD